VAAILIHRGHCPTCNDVVDEMDLQNQGVASYRHLPQEHREGMRSAYLVIKGSSPKIQQKREQSE
jgi:hypothetical protein